MDARVETLMQSRALSVDARIILVVIAVTVLGAFAFQASGYAPCELCLKERWPYYAGFVIGAATFVLAWRGAWGPAKTGFGVLAVLFVASAAVGAYHAGVEWQFWPGPADCTGDLRHATSNADFLRQLQTVKVVRCDAAAIRVLGLSLAGWNVVVSLALVAVALHALARKRLVA